MIPRYRAWDKKYEEMTRVNRIDFERRTAQIEADSGDHELRHTITRNFNEIILLQSTGLKDKNGVEVYQGDIVRCTSGCPHEVIWLEGYGGTFIGGMPAWYLSGLNSGYAWTGKEEVIGNVYQHPELLEEQQ